MRLFDQQEARYFYLKFQGGVDVFEVQKPKIIHQSRIDYECLVPLQSRTKSRYSLGIDYEWNLYLLRVPQLKILKVFRNYKSFFSQPERYHSIWYDQESIVLWSKSQVTLSQFNVFSGCGEGETKIYFEREILYLDLNPISYKGLRYYLVLTAGRLQIVNT